MGQLNESTQINLYLKLNSLIQRIDIMPEHKN